MLALYSGKDKPGVWAGLAEPPTCVSGMLLWRSDELGRGLGRGRRSGRWLPFYSLSWGRVLLQATENDCPISGRGFFFSHIMMTGGEWWAVG